MKTLLFANGSLRPGAWLHKLIEGFEFLICCDGGLRHAHALGLCPDVILGDMDSADPALLALYGQKAEIVSFASEKDFTDTELAVRFAVARNATELLIFGGLGGRFDHALANVHVLLHTLRAGVRAAIVDERNRITLMDSHVALTGERGALVSLIPLTTKAEGVTTRGLKYPLRGETLTVGATRGVSNEFLGGAAEISVRSGVLVVVEARD